MFKSIIHFLDKLEDRIRHSLSKHPVVYAFIGGFAIVLFWRGVWMFADLFDFMTAGVSILISVIIMLLTGTFVSFFIGEEIIMSGLREEKRIDQKTEDDIRKEEARLAQIIKEIEEMHADILEMKKTIESKGKKSK
ncbi:MAG TPA: hypothetical protein PK367_01855 [Candidatus Paceibacterota bacterium]|nr:hypothetical protein [Candidatus Paceibacterota bacterium]